MGEHRLRWLGRVMRRDGEDLVIQRLRVEGMRSRGRPKLTCEQVIRADLRTCRTDGTLEQSRRTWKAEIRQAETASGGTRDRVD